MLTCLHAVNDGSSWLPRTLWKQWQSLHEIVEGWACQQSLKCRVDVTPIASICQTSRLEAKSLVFQLILQQEFCKEINTQYSEVTELLEWGKDCKACKHSQYSQIKFELCMPKAENQLIKGKNSRKGEQGNFKICNHNLYSHTTLHNFYKNES